MSDKNNIQCIQNSARERMWECDYTARRPTAINDQQIETMITHYLLGNLYVNFIKPLNTGLTNNGLHLGQLQKSDAEKITSHFHVVWIQLMSKIGQQYRLINAFVGAAPQNIDAALLYINIKLKEEEYEDRLMEYTRMHQIIRVKLLTVLKGRNIPNIECILEQLLCLTYWIVLYYSKKKTKGHKSGINRHLHHFLSDLVVIFLLMLSELYPKVVIEHAQRDLVGILPTMYGIIADYPRNPIFLELVLEEICKILDTSTQKVSGSPRQRVPFLADIVYDHFVDNHVNWLRWNKKDICKIISDQTRYMVPESNPLRKNYVVAKTIYSVTQKIQYSQEKEISATFAQKKDQQKIYDECTTIMSLPTARRIDVVLKFPEKDEQINIFYHVASIGIVKSVTELIGGDLPKVDEKGWFMFDLSNEKEEEKKKHRYLNFSRGIIKQVITWTKNNKGKLTDLELYTTLAQIAVSLRELIVARCHIATKKYKGGIAATQKHKDHLDIIIHFIAFRVLVMFLLPKNTYPYGESKVAEELPQKAWKVEIPL